MVGGFGRTSLHPLLPGTMRVVRTLGLKKQGNFFGVAVYGGGREGVQNVENGRSALPNGGKNGEDPLCPSYAHR